LYLTGLSLEIYICLLVAIFCFDHISGFKRPITTYLSCIFDVFKIGHYQKLNSRICFLVFNSSLLNSVIFFLNFIVDWKLFSFSAKMSNFHCCRNITLGFDIFDKNARISFKNKSEKNSTILRNNRLSHREYSDISLIGFHDQSRKSLFTIV
jgi:hypothetical protein